MSAGLLLGAGAFLPQTPATDVIRPTDASAQDCHVEFRVRCDSDGCSAEAVLVCVF